MYTTYFDEYQKQLNSWQKQLSDWQGQFSDWQKKLMDTWMASMPSNANEVNVPETFEKVLDFQEEVVKAFLDNQEKTSQMMLDSQKEFWNNYFEKMRQQSAKASE
jgi:hypothetical protein